MHGKGHTRLRAGDLSWTLLQMGLSEAKGTGVGREPPLPLLPMPSAPTHWAQRGDSKATWVQHSTGQKGSAGTADAKAGTQGNITRDAG